jgi:hypothetical protein
LNGGTARGVGDDVIDLAVIGGRVAELVEHSWSRTSTARRVAPLNSRWATPTSSTRDGLSKTTRSNHATSSHGTSPERLSTVPLAS